MKNLLKIATGAAALVLAGEANAATFLVDYAWTSGAPMTAELTLTAADTLNAAGGYDITGVAGHVDGDAVSGLIANPNQPSSSYSADGMFIYDNVVFAGAPTVSWYGLFFHGVSGNEYNLFSDNASTYELYRAQTGVGYLANSIGTVSAVQLPPPERHDLTAVLSAVGVPEPASWTLMILGFGGVGAALRRRRFALAA